MKFVTDTVNVRVGAPRPAAVPPQGSTAAPTPGRQASPRRPRHPAAATAAAAASAPAPADSFTGPAPAGSRSDEDVDPPPPHAHAAAAAAPVSPRASLLF